jgi:hypothetical protein
LHEPAEGVGIAATLIERNTGRDGGHATAIAPLFLSRASAPSESLAAVFEPALWVIARGRKRLMLADEVYSYDPAHFLLVSVDLPIAIKNANGPPRRMSRWRVRESNLGSM